MGGRSLFSLLKLDKHKVQVGVEDLQEMYLESKEIRVRLY